MGTIQEEDPRPGDLERRAHQERRKEPLPGSSRFALLGRRKKIRRKNDRKKGRHVDRYSSTLFFFLVSIVGLNVLDSLFTMMILDRKGEEVNPVIGALINLHGDKFCVWKFVMVSFCLVLLCLHSKFKVVRIVIICLTSIYLLTVMYQIFLLSSR